MTEENNEITIDVKDLTINAIIRLCNFHSKTSTACKHCPANYICKKYFISLPKYWKLRGDKK